jgi:hypothetical protein
LPALHEVALSPFSHSTPPEVAVTMLRHFLTHSAAHNCVLQYFLILLLLDF